MQSTRFAVTAVASIVSIAAIACSSAPRDDSADMDAAAGPDPSVAATSHTWPTGGRCVQVTETYATCEDFSSCPGVAIDTTLFPNCGYSVHGDTIDPECLCFGQMCPMGAPQSCTDMASLLSSGITVESVCNQAAAGHCLNLGSTTNVNPCQLCKWNCLGVPNCMQGCNC